MKNLNDYVATYREQLERGEIQEAYAGLVKYVMSLGSTFSKNLAGQFSFGALFQGYMDYTYFYFSNDFLKERKLRFGLVLNHPNMRFELWLVGQNLEVQEKYWDLLKNTKWNKGRTARPQYSVLESVLIADPNFNDLGSLSREIEKALVKTSQEILDTIGTLP